MPIGRRDFLGGLAALAASADAIESARAADGPIEVAGAIEQRLKARVGFAVFDEETGRTIAHRGNERFALTSTFKALASAAVLARVDRGGEALDRRVIFGPADLVTYSPTTEKRVGPPGMTLAEICEAAITLSDNTAGNLLLDAIGGPAGLTAFLRSLGDDVTRLDRREPDLNAATPGDPRDTTTPLALASTMKRLALGDALAPASRDRLVEWMLADAVAGPLLRAAWPKSWRIADKTGAGGNGARAIAAIGMPPGRRPLVVTVFVAETAASMAERNAAIAEIGAAIARTIEG